MKYINQSFMELDDKRLFQKIELCGRVCYKSEDKITETSAINFVKKICVNNHGSVLEHYAFVLRVDETYYNELKEARLEFFTLTNESFPIVSFNVRAFFNYYNLDNNFEPLVKIRDFIAYTHPNLLDNVVVNETDGSISLIEDFESLTENERDLHQRVTIKLITDRGVTHELVRHRLASFSQESTRYCNYGKDKFGKEITCIRPVELKDEDLPIWIKSMEEAEKAYFDLLDRGATPQLARSVLPTALKTELCLTANIKEWKLIFDLRCSPFAHPDVRVLMNEVKTYFVEKGYIR